MEKREPRTKEEMALAKKISKGLIQVQENQDLGYNMGAVSQNQKLDNLLKKYGIKEKRG